MTLVNLVTNLLHAMLVAIPVACISWTFPMEDVFKEVRDWLKQYQATGSNAFLRKFAGMPQCSYCLSHYVTAVVLGVSGFRFLANGWQGFLAAEFAVVLIANVYVAGYHILRVKLREARAAADQQEAEAKWSQLKLRSGQVVEAAEAVVESAKAAA